MKESARESNDSFKECSTCFNKWKTRDGFMKDPKIQIIGYQVNFKHLELGLLLFNHLKCHSTLALKVEDFKDLFKGEIYSEKLTESDECHYYCLHESDLNHCPSKCECSYVREVIQIIKDFPKNKFPVLHY